MDRNAGDFAPKGEIPTEAEFARLLCDKTFVDYFNTFLSLPVFPQRLLYRFASQNLELDPPLQRSQYRSDRVKLMRWVRTHRAPYFFKSDLYLEYVLCKQLQKTQLHLTFMYDSEKSSAKDKIMDRQLMSRWLGRISGMRRFRRFMAQTAGQKSLQFWLDAERVRRYRGSQNDDRLSQLRDMEAKNLVRENVAEKPARCSIQGSEPAAEGSTDSEDALIEKILVAQGFSLRNMQNYWIPRFLIHCKLRFQRRTGREVLQVYRPNFYVVEVQSLSDISAVPEDDISPTQSSRSLAVKNVKMKRQSVSNLLSMFSSTTARHSEVSALINLEDTGEMRGEMITSGEETELEAKDTTADYREWLAEEFPLPDISEESLVSSSRHSSAEVKKPREDLSPLPIEWPPLSPSPEQQTKLAKLSILDTAASSASRREISEKDKSVMKIRSLLSAIPDDKGRTSDDIQKGITATKSDESLGSRHSVASTHALKEADVKDAEQMKPVPSEVKSVHEVVPSEGAKIELPDEVSEETAVPRLPSATAHRRLSIGTPSSLTISRGSLTGSTQSIHKTSRRRISTTSGSSIGSSTRMASGGAQKKVYKPQKRARAMSISFRLADFSFMLDKDEGDSKKDAEAEDGSLTLPQLDIQALQDVRTKAVEKKKMEEKLKRAERIKKMKQRKKVGATDDKKSKDKKKEKRQKEEMAKKAQLQKGHHVSKLTRGNLEKFDLQNAATPGSQQRRFSVSGTGRPRRRFTSTTISTDSKVASSQSGGLYGKYRSEPDHESLKLPPIYGTVAKEITFVELDDAYGQESISTPRTVNQHLHGAVMSDRMAGRPWETFMTKQGKPVELNFLHFWQTSQELITLLDTSKNDGKPAVVKQLIVQRITALHLLPSGKKFVDLGEHLSAELLYHLHGGSDVVDILQHAQKIALDALMDCWTSYQKHDNDEFLMRTAYRKHFARSTLPRGSTLSATDSGLDKDSQLSLVSSNYMLNMLKTSRAKPDKKAEAETGDRVTVAPHRMWKALELTEGISNLCNDDGELSDPSDPEVDSDDEGSLRRPKMVVYKEKKVEKPLIVPPTKEKEMPIVTSKDRREKVKSLPSSTESLDSVYRPKENKGVCTAIRKNGKTIYRPPRPKVFQDVLRDQGHIEFFRRFLIRENAELPLQFWSAVEQMKTSCRDAKARQNKTILIVRKFFGKSTDYGAALDCDADVIQDIPTMEKVTPQMILSAQACVARSMGEKWFESYKDTFPEDSLDGEEEEAGTEQKMEPREKTKALWRMFITNVTNFRRGLMNAASRKAFNEFLGKEIRREIEKQKQTGVQSKRMISNKAVTVEKLLNDLSFWTEVERFKELADNAARAAAAGTYTLEDEDYVQQKAKSIIDCFLNSQVPPKVQINIPQEMADEILDCAESGLIERGLFHDAALYVFTVLLYCWKRFCRERFAPPEESEMDISSPTAKGKGKKRRKKKKPSTPTVCGVKIKTITGTSVDDPPKFHFTLQHGLQLILPPKPKQEDVQREQLRQLLQQLYPNADGQNLEQYVKQNIAGNASSMWAQLPQPPQHAIRRLSKAFVTQFVQGTSGGVAANLLLRRMTRQFSGHADMLDT